MVRWRQTETQLDGSSVRRQKVRTRSSRAEANRLALEIEADLLEFGFWRETPPSGPRAGGDLEGVAVEYLRWKKGTRGARPATLSNLDQSLKRFFRALREVCGLEAGALIPVHALSVTTFAEVNLRLSEQVSGTTAYQTAAAMWDLWTWAADNPAWPHLPDAPRNSKSVLPRAPLLYAPSVVPTTEEVDAMLRQLARRGEQPHKRYLPQPMRMALLMRYTGLRVDQVVHIHREDLDLDSLHLRIRKGKSRREQAMQRLVPIPVWLREDLGGWLLEHPDGPLFPSRDDPSVPYRSPRNQSRYLGEAWTQAIRRDEARPGTLQPTNRHKPRPAHALRAWYIGLLERAEISDRAIDHLVGHAPRTTRGVSYTEPDPRILRRAVELIPRVDWRGGASPEAHQGLRALG